MLIKIQQLNIQNPNQIHLRTPTSIMLEYTLFHNNLCLFKPKL